MKEEYMKSNEVRNFSVVRNQFFGEVDELIEDTLPEYEADALVKRLNGETDCYVWYEKRISNNNDVKISKAMEELFKEYEEEVELTKKSFDRWYTSNDRVRYERAAERGKIYNKVLEDLKKLNKSEVTSVTDKVVKYVPYQTCPMCGGEGTVVDSDLNYYNQLSGQCGISLTEVSTKICPVCKGERIIPMCPIEGE
jgi:excinuclease UvrABC ATPase subunit